MENWAQKELSPRKGLTAAWSEPLKSSILGLVASDRRRLDSMVLSNLEMLTPSCLSEAPSKPVIFN